MASVLGTSGRRLETTLREDSRVVTDVMSALVIQATSDSSKSRWVCDQIGSMRPIEALLSELRVLRSAPPLSDEVSSAHRSIEGSRRLHCKAVLPRRRSLPIAHIRPTARTAQYLDSVRDVTGETFFAWHNAMGSPTVLIWWSFIHAARVVSATSWSRTPSIENWLGRGFPPEPIYSLLIAGESGPVAEGHPTAGASLRTVAGHVVQPLRV